MIKRNTYAESALAHKYCKGHGLEIGGAAHNPFGLDTLNVDLSDSMDTLFKQDEISRCGRAMPVDIVADGADMPCADASQDFVVSSHVLEHFPNPIKALAEWDRVVKPGGIIFMIVPHRDNSTDCDHARTPLQHLVDDYNNGTIKSIADSAEHEHFWVTQDIVDLLGWMINNLDVEWEILEAKDTDDKAGNGFTIVIRKRKKGQSKVHVVTAFSRFHLIDTIVRFYSSMNIIWHPIIFDSEASGVVFPDYKWIEPVIIPAPVDDLNVEAGSTGYDKKNAFIQGADIVDNDYYCMLDDDDMVANGVFDEIRDMDDDVVFVSMKRGHHTPDDAIPQKRYSTETLIADPENVKVGAVSGQQFICKGRVFKKLYFDESIHYSDGSMAIWLKKNYPISYEPDLFVWFNYFEPGRWDKSTEFAFGVMVNDAYRLNTVLKKSALPGQLHYIINPESATIGLNQLLEIISEEGAEIAVLAHQDMYFRQGWLDTVKAQIAKLPESWVVAGIVGKDMDGLMCGNLHDMRIVEHINTRHVHEFPQPAASFDECVIIVNMKKGFRFDESLDGFDLYGTLCVLQTWEMGGTAWIIDAFAEHYCMRPFSWFPGDDFKARYMMLYDRFNAKFGTVDSTVFVSKPRFETSANAEW